MYIVNDRKANNKPGSQYKMFHIWNKLERIKYCLCIVLFEVNLVSQKQHIVKFESSDF